MISAPVLHLHLDRFRIEILCNRLSDEGQILLVRGKAQCNDLLHRQARVKQLSRHGEVAQVFFRPNRTVLGLQRKGAAEESHQKHTGGKHYKKRSAVEALVVANGVEEVDASSDQGDEEHQANSEKARDALGVILVILCRHGDYRRMI